MIMYETARFSALPGNLELSKYLLSMYSLAYSPSLLSFNFNFSLTLLICKHHVKISSSFSTFRTNIAGCPQGSVLGPLLAILYLDQLSHITENNTYSIFRRRPFFACIPQVFEHHQHSTITSERLRQNTPVRPTIDHIYISTLQRQ